MARFGTGADLAGELGVTRQAVHQARVDGRITRSDNGKYDLDAAAIQFRMNTDPDQQRRANAPKMAAPAVGGVVPDDNWHARLIAAQAQRAELELRKAAGELVVVAEVESEIGGRLADMKVQFDALPDRAAAVLGTGDEHRRKVRQFLRDEIAQIMTSVVLAGRKVAA